jgi:hypothetical protein
MESMDKFNRFGNDVFDHEDLNRTVKSNVSLAISKPFDWLMLDIQGREAGLPI